MGKILFALAALLLCVTHSSGQGGAEWTAWNPKGSGRLGPGKIVDRATYPLPVFWERPNREYHIVGYIVDHGVNEPSPAFTDDRVVRGIVSAAKIHNADAIIMRPITTRESAAKNSD